MNYSADIKRFSFLYDGKDIFEHPLKKSVTQNGNETVYEYITEDGLKITNICKSFEKYDACEWVTWYENTADTPSKLISAVNDSDVTVPLSGGAPHRWVANIPDVEKNTRIYAPYGSTWDKNEFYCDADAFHENSYINHIYSSETKNYKNSGGRSADGMAPFFNIFKENEGFIFAIGWTGQWFCSVHRECESVTVKTGIEDIEFKLLPGEKIRTSSFVIMNYKCSLAESHNKWRRLVKEHFSLVGSAGREKAGPLCVGIWGGMSTAGVLKRIELIKKAELPIDYIWMDAGWYGTSAEESPDEFEGNWGAECGDWRVNLNHHPDGLADVSKAISDTGLKFLLWFEPERIFGEKPALLEHPEYFIKTSDEPDTNSLLNLGDEGAWNYCYNMLADIIERLNIKYYRQDFNFFPLDYWRKNDTPDRNGITEIKHIMGLYRLWDALLERFPDLMIDNCASGGRRIDIETLRRSMPLWRSDYQCPANYKIEVAQSHNMQYSTWMPYSGTGTGRAIGDVYRIRSAYAGALTTNYLYSERCELPSDSELAWIKQYMEEYLKVREYFYSDYYPLTDSQESEYSWNAAQFNRPENGDGLIEAFRHEKSAFCSAKFKLSGLDKNKAYRITDLDDNSYCDIKGSVLAEEGFEIKTDHPRCAKLFLYKAI